MEKELGTAATSLQAIFRGHQARAQVYSLMSEDLERRMNETAERIGGFDASPKSPGGSSSRRSDLVSHVLRLQERVREIQHVVKSVVPVFAGDESVSPMPSPVKRTITSTQSNKANGKSTESLKFALIGSDTVCLMAAHLCAQAGVSSFVTADCDTVVQAASVLHRPSHVGQSKALVSSELLSEAGCSDVCAHELSMDFEWLNGVDLVLLGLEEGEMRTNVCDACHAKGVPRIESSSLEASSWRYFCLVTADEQPRHTGKWPPPAGGADGARWVSVSATATAAAQLVRSAMKLCLETGELVDSYRLNGDTNDVEITTRPVPSLNA